MKSPINHMASQFNISFTSFNLKCPHQGLNPKFKVVFPDGKKQVSKESIQNNQGDYIWQDRLTFAYLSDKNHRLDKYFVRLVFKGDDKFFIGDVEVDILTLVSGPMRMDLPLDHGVNGCRVSFLCTSNEYIKSSIYINNLSVSGLEESNYYIKTNIVSKENTVVEQNLKEDDNKYILADTTVIEDIFCYKELQTDMQIEIYDKNNNEELVDKIRFGIHKLYESHELQYLIDTTNNRKVDVSISIVNKPFYVQGVSGIYHGFGRYSNYVSVPGSYMIDPNNIDLMVYNEPIAQPPEGCVKTFKPFTAKIIFKKMVIIGDDLPDNLFVKVKNTINSKREKIDIIREGNNYLVSDYKFIPLEFNKPYQLNRRYLILELCNGEGECIGDIYLNLHNLFCGPPKYIVDFNCIEPYSIRAEIDLDVVNGRTMKVKFDRFELEANDMTRNCYIKFGFDGSELRYDPLREDNGNLIFEGEYEVNIFYSTASKNIQAYVINIMVMEKKFLKDSCKFFGKYSLMKILPFKTHKVLSIPFEQANVTPFKCILEMNTSDLRNGLYGEYILLKSGVFQNGTMDISTFEEAKPFTEFSQPLYFPTTIDANYRPESEPSDNNIDSIECSVLTGIDGADKVIICLTEDDITINDINDNNNILFNHKLNNKLHSINNNNQLTLISTNQHIQLYTKRAYDIKQWMDSHTVILEDEQQKKNDLLYYCLCSSTCKGAINVTCPVCTFHPIDFSLFYYGIAHCNDCEFETYIHFKENEELELVCPMCSHQLETLHDTVQPTFLCSCGFPLGSVCKRCQSTPIFEAPKVYIRKICDECNQVQLVNESLTANVQCAKCKTQLTFDI